MPPRWACVAIVACWLGTNGWLLWNHVWPDLLRSLPGQPPPFAIDLVEEVQLNQQPQTSWIVTVNGEDGPSYRATTWVEREPANDLYVLHFHAKPITPPPGRQPEPRRLVRLMTSVCRVTPRGDLRSLEADVRIAHAVEVWASFHGEVRDGRFFGHYSVGGPNVPLSFKGDLDPVPVAQDGAVFLSFHPVQRFHRLRPGQTWRVPSLDLLPGTGLGGGRMHFVEARVLPDLAPLALKGKDTPCLVIEYTDEDQQMRTWVEQESGLVLKQEAVVGTEHWTLQRER